MSIDLTQKQKNRLLGNLPIGSQVLKIEEAEDQIIARRLRNMVRVTYIYKNQQKSSIFPYNANGSY